MFFYLVEFVEVYVIVDVFYFYGYKIIIVVGSVFICKIYIFWKIYLQWVFFFGEFKSIKYKMLGGIFIKIGIDIKNEFVQVNKVNCRNGIIGIDISCDLLIRIFQ